MNGTNTDAVKADSPASMAGESQEKFTYDRSEMLKIYLNPLSTIRPAYLSEDFDEIASQDEQGIRKLWKPDLWIQNLWASEKQLTASSSASATTTSGGTSASTNSDHAATHITFRPPRYVHNSQRMIAENSAAHRRGLKCSDSDRDSGGIVLCPQRRSFVGGCHAPVSAAVATTKAADSTPTAPVAAVGGGDASATLPPTTSQRRPAATSSGATYYGKAAAGGSNDNWRDKNARYASMYDSRRRWTGANNSSSIGDRSSSSGVGSASSYHDNYNNSQNRPQYRGGHRVGRFDGKSCSDNSTQNLPEWATDGPLDVQETIELRGFDDDVDANVTGADESWFGDSIEATDEWQATKRPDSIASKRESFEKHEPLEKRQLISDQVDGGKVPRESNAQNGLITFDKPINDAKPASSRFSKFFPQEQKISMSREGIRSENFSAENKSEMKAAGKIIPEQRISASALLADTSNVQSLFSTDLQAQISGRNDRANVHNHESPNPKILPGAMNLADLEAILCQKAKPSRSCDEKKSVSGSGSGATLTPNQSCTGLSGKQSLLQELFRSADAAAKISPPLSVLTTESELVYSKQLDPETGSDGLNVPAYLSNIANRPTKLPTQKSDPLSDPGQQQQLFAALNKLQNQQQMRQNVEEATSNAPSIVTSSTIPTMTSSCLTAPHVTALPNFPNQITPSAPFPMSGQMSLLHHQLALQAAMLQQNAMQTPGAAKLSPVPGSQEAAILAALTHQAPFFGGPPAPGPLAPPAHHDLLLNAYQKALLNKKILEEQQQLLQMQVKKMAHPCPLSIAESSNADFATSSGHKSANLSAFMPTSVLKQMRAATPSKNLTSNAPKNADQNSVSSASSTLSVSPPRTSNMSGGVTKNQPPIVTINLPAFANGPQSIATQAPSTSVPHLISASCPQMLASSLPPPPVAAAEVLRLLQVRQQQLARHQQQQQWQILQQQMGAAAILPRLMAPGGAKPFCGDDYQQMLGMAFLQQQQQQQQQIRAAGNAAADLIRQRALMAATLQQQQAQLLNSMRHPSLASHQEFNLRHLMELAGAASPAAGNLPSYPPMPTAGMGNVKPISLDELERSSKQPTAASTSANQ